MKRLFSSLAEAFKVAAGVNILITFVFFVFSKIYSTLNGVTEIGLKFESFWLILGFSLLIGALSLIFRARSLRFWIQVIIHYALLLTSFLLLFSLSGKINPAPGTMFVFIIAFTVLYAAVMAVTFLLKRFFTPKKEAKDEGKSSYTSMF